MLQAANSWRMPERLAVVAVAGLLAAPVASAQAPPLPPPAPTLPAPPATVLPPTTAPASLTRPEKPPTTAPAAIEIDLEALLQSPDVLPATVEDDVWRFEPPPARKYLQLPLVMSRVDTPTEWTDSLIKLRGGRFLAWRLGNEPWREAAPPPTSPLAQAPPPPGVTPLGEVAAPSGGSDPEAPPRLARRLTVEPDATVRWSLDYVLPGAVVKESDQIYVLKIRSDLLQKKAPLPPRMEPGTGRESAAERRQRAERIQREQLEYRQQQAVYLELRRRVMAAPGKLSVPMPARLWAVLEYNAFVRDPMLDGPAPLPWKITLEQLEALRQVRSASVPADGPLPRELQTQLNELVRLAEAGPHPLTERALALVLTSSRLASAVQPTGPVQQLCSAVLGGSEPQARTILLRHLGEGPSFTPPVLAILTQAAGSNDPVARAASVGGMFRAAQTDPGLMPLAVRNANQALGDPAAGSVEGVLTDLLTAGRSAAQTSGPPAATMPAMLQALSRDIDLRIGDEPRQGRAVVAVVAAAEREPLAAMWLDGKLLGSADAALVRKTLQVLAQAIVPAPAPGAQPPADNEGGAGTVPLPVVVHEGGVARLRLGRALPLDSPSHALIGLLRHRDTVLRDLAWKALAAFTPAGMQAESDPARGAPALSQAVLDAALGVRPTPPQALAFFRQQPEHLSTTQMLARLVAGADAEGSAAAARALIGAKGPLDQALPTLSPHDRQAFAVKLYESRNAKAPLVCGVLRDRTMGGQWAGWFGREVAEGRVPEPATWAQAINNEPALVSLLLDADTDLSLGAAAVLVGAAGGDDAATRQIHQKIRAQQNLGPGGVQTEWLRARQELYTAKLSKAAGAYRMVVRLYNADSGISVPMPSEMPPTMAPPPPGGMAPKPTSEDAVGLVRLEVDGGTVKFASQPLTLTVPDSYMALRIAKPAELKNVLPAKHGNLPLEANETPLDLMPQADGSWLGRMPILDGQVLELVLQPVKEEAGK